MRVFFRLYLHRNNDIFILKDEIDLGGRPFSRPVIY